MSSPIYLNIIVFDGAYIVEPFPSTDVAAGFATGADFVATITENRDIVVLPFPCVGDSDLDNWDIVWRSVHIAAIEWALKHPEIEVHGLDRSGAVSALETLRREVAEYQAELGDDEPDPVPAPVEDGFARAMARADAAFYADGCARAIDRLITTED